MGWADKVIANPMGYARGIPFPRARDAFKHYLEVTGAEPKLPVCICPEMAVLAPNSDTFIDVDWTGMADGTQMYGYRKDHGEDLDLDPLLTGWFREPTNPHRIVSLGRHKILPLTGGGVFCTNEFTLADEMAERSYFPNQESYAKKVEHVVARMEEVVAARFQLLAMWDRYLGDMLDHISRPQVMPWRVMRQVTGNKRPALIKALRASAISVNIHYQPSSFARGDTYYPNAMKWADTVINFSIGEGLENVNEPEYEKYVFRAARIVYEVMNASSS